jgi:flagellar motor switch/type III secretory pathway protein FliN
MMKVKRETAVKLFKALGFKTANNWNDQKLQEKILNLPEMTEGTKLNSKVQSFIDKISAADEVIIISGESQTMQKKKKTKKKASKKEVTTEAPTTKKKTAKKKTAAPAKKKAAEKPAKKAEKKSSKKITRIDAVLELLLKRKKISITELAQSSNQLCIDSGGKDHLKESQNAVAKVIKILEAVGYLTVKNDTCLRSH